MTPYNLKELVGGEQLTEKEIEVLLGAANGESSVITAERLDYSTDYIKTLRKMAAAKLYAHTTTNAVAIALATSVLNPDNIEIPDE